MNNHFKHISEEPFYGLNVLLGSYSIVLIEGESKTVKKILRNIHTNMQGGSAFFSTAWVLHFVDEVPQRIFNQWFCKSISIGGNGKELKSQPNQMEKHWIIYDAMCEIGKQLTVKGYSTQTH